MTLQSLAFLLFLIPVLFIYAQVGTKVRRVVLLVASMIFFASWGVNSLVTVLIIACGTYLIAIALHKNQTQKKMILVIGVSGLILLLGFFKYINLLPTMPLTRGLINVVMPIGMSFYTFQAIGYISDVYRKKVPATRSIIDHLVFSTFFPQALAGPIGRADQLMPQLTKLPAITVGRVSSGIQLFMGGLFCKLVIADNLGIVVDRIFLNLTEFKGLSLVVMVVIYGLQIYADFAGYTDMARGVARMFGITLLENFDRPYLSRSVGEFWRRWHMSLSSWFRDYLYIPLGGSRVSWWRTQLNILVVFTVTGMWHGATPAFALWGIAHGLVIVGEHLVQKLNSNRVQLPYFISILYTFGVVTGLWVLFRSSSFSDAFYIYQHMPVGARNFVSPEYIRATFVLLFDSNMLELGITGGAVLLLLAREAALSSIKVRKIWQHLPKVIRYLLYATMVVLLVSLRNAEVAKFIYVMF